MSPLDEVERLRRRTHEMQERHDRECSRLRTQMRALKRSRDYHRAVRDLGTLSHTESREVLAPIFERHLADWYRAFKLLDQTGERLGLKIYVDDGEQAVPCHHRRDDESAG